MYIYINNEDLRTHELFNYFKDAGFDVTNNISDIPKCNICYFGIRDIDEKKIDFRKNTNVYVLANNEKIEKLCKKNDANCIVLYKDESFVYGNAILTTEALISFIISDNNICIHNKNILVMGYGMCGKDISYKLKQLGAHITVSNRNQKYKEEVLLNGFDYKESESLTLENFDFIINTVPYPVFTSNILNTRLKNTKLYDISSKPYGVKEIDRFDRYYILPSLPSRYAYKSAASLIFEAIKKGENFNV